MTEKNTVPVSSRRGSSGTRLVAAIEQYLAAHSADKFSLPEISEALHINGNYLLRVYKARTGHTLLWYHNAVRCEIAKDMLEKTECSIAEISSAVGYVSPAHFSHQFKKMTGVAPSDWRSLPSDSLPAEYLIDPPHLL